MLKILGLGLWGPNYRKKAKFCLGFTGVSSKRRPPQAKRSIQKMLVQTCSKHCCMLLRSRLCPMLPDSWKNTVMASLINCAHMACTELIGRHKLSPTKCTHILLRSCDYLHSGNCLKIFVLTDEFGISIIMWSYGKWKSLQQTLYRKNVSPELL